jgi:hypothetical protein
MARREVGLAEPSSDVVVVTFTGNSRNPFRYLQNLIFLSCFNQILAQSEIDIR